MKINDKILAFVSGEILAFWGAAASGVFEFGLL